MVYLGCCKRNTPTKEHPMAEITRDGFTFNTDKRGFPIATCGRCGGTGRYSFNQLDGDMCYGCHRTGWEFPGKVASIHAEYLAAVDAATKCTAERMQPGDLVRYGSGDEYREVKALHPSPRRIGSCLIGTDESQRTYSYEIWVEFTDGTQVSHGGALWGRKNTGGPLYPAFAERAQAEYVRYLAAKAKRDARKAAKAAAAPVEPAAPAVKPAAPAKPEAAPVPTGKALTVEGVILSTRVDDNPYGPGGTLKMLVKGDGGWRVWTTVPAGTLPDQYGVADIEALPGKRIRFTATVELARKGKVDPSFGYASRPRKPVLVG
jgi:hypothetical protein